MAASPYAMAKLPEILGTSTVAGQKQGKPQHIRMMTLVQLTETVHQGKWSEYAGDGERFRARGCTVVVKGA